MNDGHGSISAHPVTKLTIESGRIMERTAIEQFADATCACSEPNSVTREVRRLLLWEAKYECSRTGSPFGAMCKGLRNNAADRRAIALELFDDPVK
jgi:hypothetical protein